MASARIEVKGDMLICRDESGITAIRVSEIAELRTVSMLEDGRGELRIRKTGEDCLQCVAVFKNLGGANRAANYILRLDVLE